MIAVFVASTAFASAGDDPDDGPAPLAATDSEVVAAMRRHEAEDQAGGQGPVPAAGANGAVATDGADLMRADRPRGLPQNAWRYEFYNGRWWFWTPDDRWAFYNGRRWVTFPAGSIGSQWARGGGAASNGATDSGAEDAAVGGGYYNALSAESRGIAGGFNANRPSANLSGALGSEAGALERGSLPGRSTVPGRVGGASNLFNRGIGAGVSGGPGVIGAGGSMAGGAGGSVGGGAGGSQFGGSRSGDAGSGVGGGSVGGTSVTGGAGAGSAGGSGR